MIAGSTFPVPIGAGLSIFQSFPPYKDDGGARDCRRLAQGRDVIALRGAGPGFGRTPGFGENKVVLGR